MDSATVCLGTLGLKESAEDAVSDALDSACQIIDTGEHYGNLELVGAGLKKSARKPFLIIKLSGMPAGAYDTVRDRVRRMLALLEIEKAELCLMHWPGFCSWYPTDMAPLATPADFQEKISSWEEFCENIAGAWANMVKLREEGLVANVGTSNFYRHHLDELAARCEGAKPFANEIYIDPTNQEAEFVSAMQSQGIRVLAYRPVAYRPFPDEVKRVAERLGEGTSAQAVVLAWLLKRGVWPLVKCRGAHIKENFETATLLKEKLSDDDLSQIGAADAAMRGSAEWFAKIWRTHNATSSVSEDDVQMLCGLGIDEAKARACLEKCGGNLDAAMDAAFAE